MHGVGLETTQRVLALAGLPAPAVVREQADPDPDFPTAPFPNPEEPGTLDLATALADRTGASLVLANDPDADRLAIAVPSASRLAAAVGERGRAAARLADRAGRRTGRRHDGVLDRLDARAAADR